MRVCSENSRPEDRAFFHGMGDSCVHAGESPSPPGCQDTSDASFRRRPAGRPASCARRTSEQLRVPLQVSALVTLIKKGVLFHRREYGGKQRFLNRPSLYSPAFFRREESLDMRLKLGQGRSIVRGRIALARTKQNPPVVRVQRYDIDLNVVIHIARPVPKTEFDRGQGEVAEALARAFNMQLPDQFLERKPLVPEATRHSSFDCLGERAHA